MQRKLLREEVLPVGKIQMYENVNARHERMLDIQLFDGSGIPTNVLTFTTDNLNPFSTASLMAESTVYDSLVLYYKLKMQPSKIKTFADGSVAKAFKFLRNLELYHMEIQGAFMSRCYKFYFKGRVHGEVLNGLDQNYFNMGVIHLVVEASTFDTETYFYTERIAAKGGDKKELLHIGRYSLTNDELIDGINQCTNISATTTSIYNRIIRSLK